MMTIDSNEIYVLLHLVLMSYMSYMSLCEYLLETLMTSWSIWLSFYPYAFYFCIPLRVHSIHTSSISSLLRLQLHGAIYHPDSFVLMLRHCVNLKAIRYESTSLNRIAADKSHRVIVA